VRGEYQKNTTERLQTAVQDVSTRLFDAIRTMHAKCTEPDEGQHRPRLHESTYTSALELCEVAKGLNIFNDPDIEQARAGLAAALGAVDLQTLRESPEARAVTRSRMDALLSKFE